VQSPELGRDVGEGDGLQRPATTEGLVVGGERLLYCLPDPRELVEEPGTVEVLDGGDAAGVGVGPEIAPRLELLQRVGHGLGVDHGLEHLGHILGPQVHGEPAFRRDEGKHDPSVEPLMGHGEIDEALVLGGVHRASLGSRRAWREGRGHPRQTVARAASASRGALGLGGHAQTIYVDPPVPGVTPAGGR